MTGSIDLNPNYLATVERILAEHVPDCEVRAFGSRANWTAKDYSDLDLAVVGEGPLDWRTLADLKEAFEESDLPMRVDVLDWHDTAESFRDVIERGYVVVQKGAKRGTGEWRTALWGELATLEYGKSLRDYDSPAGVYEVYGTNGQIGWHSEPLCTYASVIIGRKGAYRGVHYSPDPFFVIDTASYLKPKVEMDTRWAYYELLTQDINGMDSGSAIPSTSRGDFYGLPVQVPPLPEQRAIAHVLGTLDDKIELNRRMNETLEAMARALFKSWFVDFEPVRAKMAGRWRHGESLLGLPAEHYDLFPDRLVDSELGEAPDGWEVKPLDSIATFLNGLALQKYPATDGSALPVIKIAQLRAGHTLGADSASNALPPQYVVHDGDVLFSWSGSLELDVWAGGEGALNQHLFKVTSQEYPKWLYYRWGREHLPGFREIAAGKTTTMGHIQRHHLREALTVIPDAAMLKAMDRYIQPLLDRSLALGIESRRLATQRDALLPGLVSGEVGVGDTEEFEIKRD